MWLDFLVRVMLRVVSDFWWVVVALIICFTDGWSLVDDFIWTRSMDQLLLRVVEDGDIFIFGAHPW